LGVRPLQESKTKIDPLSEEELNLALSHIEPHFLPLFTTLAFTGARPNELLALRWADLDWVREEISISKGRVAGIEGLPKTRSGERLIPMTVQVKTVLRNLQASSLRSKEGYVFVDPNGQPINKHLDRVWRRALRRCGLRHRPSYQLRHTFTTQAIIKGLPVPYIAKILGHSTIDSLIRNYMGWIDAYTKENKSKLLGAFKNASIPEPRILDSKKGALKGAFYDQVISESLTG
jgi:integrase